jgi:ankyrin repeat protein
MIIARLTVMSLAAFVLAASVASAADPDLRLVEASRRDDAAAVKALMIAGVDVDTPAPDGATALHWAVQNDDLAVVDELIRKGAKVSATTDLGITPLWIAAKNSNAAIIARLLTAGADPNIAPPTGHTALMNAARQGGSEAVKALLAGGADPNAREAAHDQTALMWAAAQRHPEVVRVLLEGRADVRIRSKSWKQRENICCQLHGGDENSAWVDMGGFSALLFAAQSGDVESARLLIAAGADVNDTAANGMSALVVAAHLGQSDVAKALLDAGADPNAAGAGYTALHVSATRGDLATTQALIDHRADLNARQQEGSPTLRVNSGHALDFRMKGATPFFLAARSAQLDVMRLLAAKGADTALTLDDGRTAVTVLAAQVTQEGPRLSEAEAVEAIKLAIQLGTPVNRAASNGDTALHVAATWRRDAVVQALADNGAALNLRNGKGETPLTIALNPPAKQEGSGVSDDYLYLLKHTSTAALLRKLGAQS